MAKIPSGSDIYGRRPVLQSPGEIQNSVLKNLEQAIPGFSGLSSRASGMIDQQLGGQLGAGTQGAINQAAATQAAAGGMPGSNRMGGTLMGNRFLRDIGLESEQQQQRGFGNLLNFLKGSSGTSALTPEQEQEQINAQEQYASAPDPTAAGKHTEKLFDQRYAMANPGPSHRKPIFTYSGDGGFMLGGGGYTRV